MSEEIEDPSAGRTMRERKSADIPSREALPKEVERSMVSETKDFLPDYDTD